MSDDELIAGLIRDAGRLADLRGAERCALILDMIDRMQALRRGLAEEHRHHEDDIRLLNEQLTRLTTPHPQEGETVVGGEIYRLGE